MNYIIGVDPGKDGACTIMDINGKIIEKKVMPKIGKEFDSQEFNNFILKYKDDISHVYIENVHAIFGASAKSTFSFGKVCGLIEGIILSHKIPFTLIYPKKWQSIMFEGIPEQRKPSKINKNGKFVKGRIDTKVMSELACRRLFPNEDLRATERSKKVHDGITDSILLCEYGRRQLFK
jgi:hypothetical protein